MDLYRDKLKHDKELNAKELEIINDIAKILSELEEDMKFLKSNIDVLKSVNFYEIVTRDLPKSNELKILIDVLEKNAKVSRNLSLLTKKIMELYRAVNEEII